MHGQLSFTLGTGPRACGKTKIFKLIASLAKCPNVVYADTSEILKLHIEKKTPTGLELQKHTEAMKRGSLVPADDLVFRAVMEWFECMSKKNRIYHVLLAGSPRSKAQSLLWKGRPHSVRVIHTFATKAQVYEGISLRQQETGTMREDELSHAVETAWFEYEEKIRPGLEVFNGHVLNTNRSEPLMIRVEKTINHMDIPDHVRRRWFRRLNEKDNPVALEIRSLDSKSVKNKKKPESMTCSHR